MTETRWLEPSLTWNGNRSATAFPQYRAITDLVQPVILEIASDEFMPEFLAAMQVGPSPEPVVGKTNDSATPLAITPPTPDVYLHQHRLETVRGAQPVYKLWQPLHGRFYLVTASLVCERTGLPDRTVNHKANERTSFVLRRIEGDEEFGWVEGSGWISLAVTQDLLGEPVHVLPGEEKFAMNAISVRAGLSGEGRFEPEQRTIYYGYLATGKQEKYQEPLAADQIANYWLTSYMPLVKGQMEDNIFKPWRDLRSALSNTQKSLDVLLELAYALSDSVPAVWKKLADATAVTKPAETALVDALNAFTFVSGTSSANFTVVKLGDTLRNAAIREQVETRADPHGLSGFALRLAAKPIFGDATDPNRITSTTAMDVATITALQTQMNAALEAQQPSAEVEQIIKNLAKPERADGQQDRFVVRVVYDYDPDCPPVVSEQSRTFEFAKIFDPDAPARFVRIEMPSIRPTDLKKYAKGVGIQMSKDLFKKTEALHKGMLEGDAPNPEPNVNFAMICTFSIQIIMLVALIVMFIFLILLNIVFWWMAFLRICIPVPTKA